MKQQWKMIKISSFEKILERMRSDTLEIFEKLYSSNNIKTYEFKSLKFPSAIAEINFENDSMLIINKVEFQKVNKILQTNVKSNFNEIRDIEIC